MSLSSSALTIGKELLHHRQDIGNVLKQLSALGRSGENVLNGFASHLSNATGHQHDTPPSADSINTLKEQSYQAFEATRFFDTDHNGIIDKQELTQKLAELRQKPFDNNTQETHMQQLGEHLLTEYGSIANLDGEGQTISFKDVTQIIGQYTRYST